MAIPGGLSAQIGFAEESTPGMAVTVTRFLEFNSETLGLNVQRIESQGLRPSRRNLGSSDWVAGRKSVEGDIELEVQPNGLGLILKHMLGSVATTTPSGGTNSRTHTASVGDINSKSLTIQKAFAGTDGTARGFTYAGCKFGSWTLSCDAEGFLMLSLSVDGMSETTATAVASASYAATNVPLVYTQGVIQVAGSAFDVRSFSLEASNALAADRYFIRSSGATKKEQLENGLREYTGSLAADFEDLTAYNRFVNGTTASFSATFTGAVAIEGSIYPSVVVTCPTVRFDGETPTVGGPELVEQSLPFKVLDEDMTIAVTNTDTAA